MSDAQRPILVLAIPTAPEPDLSPNKPGKNKFAITEARKRSRHAVKIAWQNESLEPGWRDPVLPANARLVIDYQVYWGKRNLKWDDDSVFAAFKPVRDELADQLGLTSDRNVRNGRVTLQGKDPDGVGYSVARVYVDTEPDRLL